VQVGRTATVIADRYAVEEDLGRGRAGMTLRAEDRLLGRDVALTLIHPALGDDQAFATKLSEQTRRVASLSGPGIARLLDTGEQEGVLFLVREHVGGRTASALLDSDGPFTVEAAVRVALGVLNGLATAHGAGVLQLAVGLEDVIVANDGTTFVTGLGVASSIAATGRSDAERFLCDGLAPELTARLNGNRHAPTTGITETLGAVDARTDVFAVGAMLFELLTGDAPAGRSSARAVRADVPRSVDRVVVRALAPDPADRYPNARAFAAALHATTAGLPTEPDDAVASESSRFELLRTWLAAPLAICAVAAVVIGVGVWLGRLEVGGPLGIRPADDRGRSAPAEPVIDFATPVSAVAFDPFGDGQENDATAPYAVDGDPATAWRSENYFDGSMHKQGVGLVFDLGDTRDVAGFRLVSPHPGYVFHVAVGDDPESLIGMVGDPHVAEPDARGALQGSGRYVLVWITTVVPTGDGTRAEIAEFRVVVEPA
jgi:eukaryotic-like serine/threonine-protein kinase